MEDKQNQKMLHWPVIHLPGTFPLKSLSPHLVTGIGSVE